MKFSFSKFSAATALVLGLCTPLVAHANTSESSWKLSSSLQASQYDNDNTLSFNVGRCEALFNEGIGSVSFVFSLNDSAKFSSDAKYSVKFAHGSATCASKKLDQETSDDCENLINNAALTNTKNSIVVEIKTSELSGAKDAKSCENLAETSYIHLIVNDPNNGIDNIYTVTYNVDFRTARPAAPDTISLKAGGSSIEASWSEVDKATSYNVYYTESEGALESGMDTASISNAYGLNVGKNSVTIKSKIVEDTTYYVGVTAVDRSGNESVMGAVNSVKTVESQDLWESYKAENVDVDGGFCFIATAAWGSTQEPHVALLRQFRDDILKKSAPGRAFIDTYYRLSPPLAYYIGQHSTARSVTRTLLWPLYGFAYLALNAPLVLGGIFLTLCLGLALLIRRVRKNRAVKKQNTPLSTAVKSTAAALLLSLAALCAAPTDAYADPTDDSPVNMMVEFKAGMYTPDSLGSAFDKHFKDHNGFIVEGEYDWQFWRGVGSLGVGLNVGYGNVTGNAIDESGESTVDETTLHWLPIRLSLIYRFDYLWQRFSFPITLYAKAGLDYYFYWMKDASEETSVATDGSKGYGGTFGFHVVAGLALVLDWICPSMAKSFDVEWGVNNSYLFAEFLYANINDFYAGGAFNLSDQATFEIGIGLEF